jgi:hypothetical protein
MKPSSPSKNTDLTHYQIENSKTDKMQILFVGAAKATPTSKILLSLISHKSSILIQLDLAVLA